MAIPAFTFPFVRIPVDHPKDPMPGQVCRVGATVGVRAYDELYETWERGAPAAAERTSRPWNAFTAREKARHLSSHHLAGQGPQPGRADCRRRPHRELL